jgi:hypothetical protein
MALYADNMLEIAMELAMTADGYADMALKFLEHDALITSSLVRLGEGIGMWDEEDGFFYDVLRSGERWIASRGCSFPRPCSPSVGLRIGPTATSKPRAGNSPTWYPWAAR